ncbi:Oligopeptide transport system permease protein [Staphylococcus aureus]|nr:Oligopeptide transport system permease protein [Staphylococcus aureus]
MVKLTTKIASLKLFASYAIATYILVYINECIKSF